ncbi:alpha-L-fucosidase [Maribellus sp. CM-23]|uniref:alpha-L-fucosidase n=1 Tax=Maribellus sp. CM-23 TaxID=2781026 RepID=UPI001F23521F|nr:alpha-L-fucosidase [Maribellus sp. CM-23]MCE4564942.1 alpha-L-fucosidase [Maribellus sp. CM-23]
MDKRLKKIYILIGLTLFCGHFAHAQWSVKGETTDKKARWNHIQMFSEEEWDASNFATDEEMQWFNDARYGMFIHFGLSTYIGKDLSWGMCYTRKAPDKGHGPIPDSVWVKYPEHFVFEDFDAKEWVDIAKCAGMKYIVTIAKHHDGFHMWDTQYSDFKVTNTPFGRDYLKEIADACHEAGMKFGIYYSQRDWYHPDYAPVDTALIDQVDEAPYFRPKPGVKEVKPGASHQKYIDYQFNVVRELCTNYGKVDIFWFDASWWGGMFTADMWESEKLTRMIRELQPGIIINNRASLPGDFDTPEQKIGMYQSRPWESCVTLCSTWSWSDTPVKSKKEIVNMLTATACGNGNMLLSWGPKWEGQYDPLQVSRLEEMGQWLKRYGQTIYNTKGGPWYPEKWGGSTYRGKTAFVHITGKVGDTLTLPAVQNEIVAAKTLTGGEVTFSQNKKQVLIDLEKVNRNEESVIIELTFKNEIEGMVAEKRSKSLFDDPMYGKQLTENVKLKLSSESPFDNPKHHNLLLGNTLFNSPFAFHTQAEKEPYAIIDLGKLYAVTGVDLYNEKRYNGNPVTFEVLVSEDGNNWQSVEKQEKAFDQWEVTVAQFNAGIQLPGVKARYVKVLLKADAEAALHLKRLHIYAQ